MDFILIFGTVTISPRFDNPVYQQAGIYDIENQKMCCVLWFPATASGNDCAGRSRRDRESPRYASNSHNAKTTSRPKTQLITKKGWSDTIRLGLVRPLNSDNWRGHTGSCYHDIIRPMRDLIYSIQPTQPRGNFLTIHRRGFERTGLQLHLYRWRKFLYRRNTSTT